MAKKKAKGKRSTLNRAAKKKMFQEIDIKHYLGEKPTAKQKKVFADLAIDEIRSRTLQNEDINGKKFIKYDKKYAKQKGVSVNDVNLFLKGKLLDSIGRRKSNEKVSTVFLQMKKGKETLKAFNHNTGDKLKKREFFGITDEEARKIAQRIKDEEPDKKTLKELRESFAGEFSDGE